LDSPTHERYSLSPVRHESQKLLMSPKRSVRQVSKVPFKVHPSLPPLPSFFFTCRLLPPRFSTHLNSPTITTSTSWTGLPAMFSASVSVRPSTHGAPRRARSRSCAIWQSRIRRTASRASTGFRGCVVSLSPLAPKLTCLSTGSTSRGRDEERDDSDLGRSIRSVHQEDGRSYGSRCASFVPLLPLLLL
jgi:hypothetical protein